MSYIRGTLEQFRGSDASVYPNVVESVSTGVAPGTVALTQDNNSDSTTPATGDPTGVGTLLEWTWTDIDNGTNILRTVRVTFTVEFLSGWANGSDALFVYPPGTLPGDFGPIVVSGFAYCGTAPFGANPMFGCDLNIAGGGTPSISCQQVTCNPNPTAPPDPQISYRCIFDFQQLL